MGATLGCSEAMSHVHVELFFLIGTEERNSVPIWQLRLVDDLDAFNAFPWGSHVYKYTIFWLKKAHVKRPKRYNLFGLGYMLLVSLWNHNYHK